MREAAANGTARWYSGTQLDVANGRILSESEFFDPLAINSLTTPGFGGRVHFPIAPACSSA